MDRREIEVLGLRTPLIETGPAEDDEPIVFLHGHPGSSRDWEGLMSRIDFGRAVAFDLPGLGKADKPDDWNYTIGTYATFVAAALDVLGVERAHLVMHDLGGGAGLLWAAAHPDAFASAVIMGTGVLKNYDWHWLAAMQRRPFVGPLMVRLTNERGFRTTMRRAHRESRELPEWFVDQLWEDYDLRSRRAMMEMYRGAPPGEPVGQVDDERELRELRRVEERQRADPQEARRAANHVVERRDEKDDREERERDHVPGNRGEPEIPVVDAAHDRHRAEPEGGPHDLWPDDLERIVILQVRAHRRRRIDHEDTDRHERDDGDEDRVVGLVLLTAQGARALAGRRDGRPRDRHRPASSSWARPATVALNARPRAA